MVYQLMFAIITPALITGATAGTDEIRGKVLFLTLWFVGGVRAAGAHGVGQGRTAERLRSAGNSRRWILPVEPWCTFLPASRRWCVRCTSGSAPDIQNRPMPPHSLVLSFIRRVPFVGGMVRIQRGERAGFECASDERVCATHFAAAERRWLERGGMASRRRAERAGAISGAVADSWPSPRRLICRADASAGDWIARGRGLLLDVTKVKAIFGYDDALDAFGVHGAGGTIGALLTGVFAQQAIIRFLRGQSQWVVSMVHWGRLASTVAC